MDEEIQWNANTPQRRRDKTPKRVIYGKGEPSITGVSGNDELLRLIQGHASQDEDTGAVHPEGARGSSADITICLEL